MSPKTERWRLSFDEMMEISLPELAERLDISESDAIALKNPRDSLRPRKLHLEHDPWGLGGTDPIAYERGYNPSPSWENALRANEGKEWY